jgi:acyl carrier protein
MLGVTMDVYHDIQQIIAEHKGVSLAEVTPEKSFEELDIDSLDAIDIIYQVEDKYGIDVPQDAIDLENTKTVGDVLDLVERVIAGNGSGGAAAG